MNFKCSHTFFACISVFFMLRSNFKIKFKQKKKDGSKKAF